MNARTAIALAVAPLACIAMAGCGGGGTAASSDRAAAIPHLLGLQLVGRTSAVEASLNAGDQCTALEQATKLQQAEASAIAAGQIPAELRATLLDSTQALAAQIHCTPPLKHPPPPGHDHHHHGKHNREGD
jgi:hypothetical protein